MFLLPLIVALAFSIFLFIIPMWKIYEKAGQPGWAAIVPYYNSYILIKMAGKPMWWFWVQIALIVPYIIAVFTFSFLWLFVMIPLAILVLVLHIWTWNIIVHKFGKDSGYTVGVILLGFVFIPLLGYGDAKWQDGNQTSLDIEGVLDSGTSDSDEV